MDVSFGLHTFARRTCISRHAQWASIYSDLVQAGRDRKDFGDYTDEAYSVFPRHNVLKAVLDSIEGFDPAALPGHEELWLLLIQAAASASSDFTRPIANPIHQRAMMDEREVLAQILRDVNIDEVAKVEPLFYRRTLSTKEVWTWRNTIKDA